MDNLTHTLFALTIARTPLGRAGRGTTAALIVASNIPDIDIVSALRGGTTAYLRWHRGPTHGPLGVVGLGLVSAAGVWAWLRWSPRLRPRPQSDPSSDGTRRLRADDATAGRVAAGQGSENGEHVPLRAGRANASFAMLAAVSIVGALLHVLMDLPTSYGTRLLSPFDWHWYAADWLPIIDVYLLVALAASLGFGAGSPAARRRNAALVLALMAANYGARGVAHHEAMRLAPRLFGPTLPSRCDTAPGTASPFDRWPRETSAAPPAVGRRCLVEIAAMPAFTSPFEWRIVAHMSNAYEVHDLDLLDAGLRGPATSADVFWRRALRYPNIWTPAVERAAATRLGQIFLGFSRFPAARSFVDPKGVATVRWTDLRFAAGLVALEQPIRRATPFSAIVRIGPDGRVLQEWLGR